MKAQWFVSRRHAGHEHDGRGGYGVRLPAKVDPQTLPAGQFAVGDSDVTQTGSTDDTVVERPVVPSTLTTIERGSGDGGIVYFDAPSGAGGDMLVASLVDLGVPWSVVTEAVAALGLGDVDLELRRGNSGALSGLRFIVDASGLDEASLGERSYQQIRELIAGSRLSPDVAQRVLRVFERLARAEARAHDVALDDVHFHEVGAIDSLVDIVGVCAALDYLGGAVWCSPLPLGRGFVSCRHGVIPLPAPAAVECLLGLRTYDADIDKELVTPTAAAVFGALAEGSSGWPNGVLTAVGWGRGSLMLPGRPNLLRAVLVKTAASSARGREPGA